MSRLIGAALLAEVQDNNRLAATQLAIRCGYTKTKLARKTGERTVKPDMEGYLRAYLLARGENFGLILPEEENAVVDRSGELNTYKVQKNNSAVIPGRHIKSLNCKPGEFISINFDPERNALIVIKDVESSAASAIEGVDTQAAVSTNDDLGEDEEEDEEDEDEDEDEDNIEVVEVQQPATTVVDSTTVRVPHPVG
jgi:hypothetical protein